MFFRLSNAGHDFKAFGEKACEKYRMTFVTDVYRGLLRHTEKKSLFGIKAYY